MDQNVSWGNVLAFLALTFGLNWLLALLIYLKGGLTLGPSIGLLLQLYMLFPAFSAILLQLFVFKESPIYFKTYRELPHLFYAFFLVYTGLFAGLVLIAMDNLAKLQLVNLITLGLSIGGLLFVVLLYAKSGTDPFKRAGLSFGPPKYFFYYGLFIVGLYCGMTLLNIAFNLGVFVDVEELLEAISGSDPEAAEQLAAIPPTVFVFTVVIESLLLGPFMGLLITFGEEYGWRGYLQNELTKLGRVRGVVLVGLIWGLWHAPLIAMGYNYPNHPFLGIFLMSLYTIALAFILGLAYFQSRSVWLAAYLHGLNNQIFSFLVMMIYTPTDMTFSFGIGIYGLFVFVLIVILLLRHPAWRESPAESGNPLK